MRIPAILILAVALIANASHGQQSAPQDPTAPTSNNRSEVQKVGGRVSAPVPISMPDPEYTDYARRKGIEGVCIVGLIVDAQGHPQNVHLVKSLEPGLDKNAIKIVEHWRFKPAMKDGTTPVPVMVSIEVDFHLYQH